MAQDNLKRATVSDTDIAIVGMAAHLPGAASVTDYWANLRDGIESIRHLSEAELLENGESPTKMRHRNYVPAAAVLDRFEHFDADFFGFSPKEAAILDPQHRQFLETGWEALENAGHVPENFKGAIGVYAGCGMGSYFYFNLCSNRDLVENTGMFLLRHTGNDKDFLATRVSHIFDLKGPSINVQTACSTSLVAVHFAAQALLNGECDMALAGGVTIELPHARGYVFNEGEILSPDGHCHAFDHRAQGTVFGSGAGCVVLRRAVDAIRDGDHIWAILKGSAINNDGAAKAGYLAPSVEGQARCIAEAQAIAGVTSDTVDYVECHGTGTYLGDPIEVAALTQGFAESAETVGTCRIGSVKTNIGHLDTAAGVASLIKVALSMHHRQMPPSLGYEAANPAIDFETSPFTVNDRLTDWAATDHPRRAGVNSLGVGGTNAHAVLEEAPERAPSEESLWPFQPIVISAKSKAALDGQAARLAAHLRAHPQQPLADVAWTLKEGRRAFEKRRVLVAESHAEAADLLEGKDPRRVFNHDHLGEAPEVVFMFPGGGAQYAGMARDLYDTEPEFKDWMDRGLAILQPKLDYDIRALWLPEKGAEATANERLRKPSVQLPLIMITEYALAKLYESWGVSPAALIGHSMGENTAACLAGVMNFEDCIGLVHLRGQLFDTVPPGGMLSVPLDEAVLRSRLTGDLDMASVNAPGLCVVSGPDAALAALAAELAGEEVETQRIQIDIAAHSRMLEPILGRFGDYLRAIRLQAPQLPIISNRTGQPLTVAEATSPEYWVQHLRNTVMFQPGMATLMAEPGRVFMEMGPGRAMSSLAQANGVAAGQVIPALRHPEQKMADDAWHMVTIARLWACGVNVDWEPIWGGMRRVKLPLPTYAFQRKPYFIAPAATQAVQAEALPMKVADLAQWGWQSVWKPKAADGDLETAEKHSWLVFADEAGLAAQVVAQLRAAGQGVVTVRTGDAFARDGEGGYILNPERGREGYDQLVRELVASGHAPDRIAHFWLVTERESFRPGSSFFHRNVEQGFYALMFLGQAMAEENLPRPIHVSVVTTGAAQLKDEGLAYPEKAAVSGPVKVMPRELPGVTCATLDVVLPVAPKGWRAKPDLGALARLATQVCEDLLAEPANFAAVLRGEKRYERALKRLPLTEGGLDLAEGAPVLITGGFGGIGLTLAEKLASEVKAKILLIARRELPARDQWAGYVSRHGAADAVGRRILAVQRLESLGAEVMVARADVCNAEEMRAAIAQGEQSFGKLRAVIHAAGVVDDGPLLTKTPAAVEEVFAPKLHGTHVLHDLFPDGSLDLMVLFSSTSTVTGPAGQVDYVAANEYLNAYAQARKGGKTRVLALNWGIWSDVGMAAEALAERSGAQPPAPKLPVSRPLLDESTYDRSGARQFSTRLATDRWILDGHRTKDGTALIPGTGYIEIAAEAAAEEGWTAFELRDLMFFRALDVADGATREMRVTLASSDEGFGFEVRAGHETRGRTGFVLNVQGRLLPLAGQAGRIDPAGIAARCGTAQEDPRGLRSPQEEHLNFGPRWRVLHRMAFGQGEGIATLTLPLSVQTDLSHGWLMHPALLDLATGWAMGLIDGYHPDHLWVPVSYGRIRVWQALPARVVSWVRNAAANRSEGPVAVFDVTLADDAGNVVAEIEGFTIRKLEGALKQSAPAERDMVFDAVDGAKPSSPQEERLVHNLSQGIRAEEGAEAFVRALATGRSQVIVSSLDLPALVRQADQAEAARPEGQTFARPDLDSEYVEPRNDIERTLVGFWQELLGVGQVGVEDDFFALGGHSLIAVRLFAMVKKAFRVDFPISILFEAPTIAACGALIEERIGPQDGSAPAAARAEAPKRRFTHLVTMHEGAGGSKKPFFLVAGMFGNVLNLRHLAQLLGSDRPFYGLQARGLFGDAEPHRSIPEAAQDYIAELRQVQPRGPYLLGGFSGGGLTAWEMARQLEAEGEEVALLVLLDTPLPMRPPLTRTDKVLIKWAELKARGPGYLADWAKARYAWEIEKRRPKLATETTHQFHNAEIEAAFRAAIAVYALPLRKGATALFRPPQDLRWKVTNGHWVSGAKEYVFADNDLTRFAPALSVHEVPGDHDSMVLEPNVRVMAARLREVIAEAEALDPSLREAAE